MNDTCQYQYLCGDSSYADYGIGLPLVQWDVSKQDKAEV